MIRKVLLVLCAAGLLLTGCTVKVEQKEPTISQAEFERGIADALQQTVGRRPDTVACPGPVPAKVGETVRCTLSDRGTRAGLTAVITSLDNGKANYHVKVDDKPLGQALRSSLARCADSVAATRWTAGAIRETASFVKRPSGPDTDTAAGAGVPVSGAATHRTPNSCSLSSTA
ncbi:DUF4333 domain-containing protein [Amycolatopsis alkalitolerans]|uniref:DUF4333 domain-containing protein n=1 Tax=Amycolatopsis alkalitolerans TaxID=2547244 RepID=A0A5C4LTN9_9PSEU|nr:DUF4333 domain-containing protein [Amycolatopsis alkalitolerans]